MSAPTFVYPPPTTGGTPVGGSGTIDTIPVWSSGTTLGDSIISQNNGTNRLLVAGGTAAAAANGTDITLQAQSGGAGNTNGGSIFLQPGANAGTGTRGFVRIDNGVGLDANLFLGNGTGPSAPYGVGLRAYSGQSHASIFANAGYAAARASIGMVSGGVYTPALSADPSGNVGIGTASPKARGDVSGTSASQSDWGLLFVNSNDAFGADKGGSVSFGGLYQAGTVTHWAQVSGRKENGTSGQYGGYLAFATRTNGAGTNAERMRIDSSGNVGIGTASPGQRLAVRSPDNVASTNVVRIESNNAAQAVLLRYSSIYGSGGNLDLGTDAANDVVFKPNSVERARVTSAGNVQAGSGTTTMTDGFFYIPAAAGAPTGVPTAIAGRVPMYYDTTNNEFYVYNTAWKKVALT
jgi:hypothetical protein